MQRTIAMAAVAAFGISIVAICDAHVSGGNSATQKLTGTWEAKFELDEAKLNKMMKGKVQPAQIKAITALMKTMFAKMTMTITMKADGTSVAKIKQPDKNNPTQLKETVEKGTWKVVSEKGNTATLKVTEKDKKGKVKTNTIKIRFIGNNAFQITEDAEFAKVPIKMPTLKRKK